MRWLRTEYQSPQGVQQAGIDIDSTEIKTKTVSQELAEWPKNLAEQAQVIQRLLQQFQYQVSASELNKQFKQAKSCQRSPASAN